MNDNSSILTGTSNYGLSISGQNVALSLMQITTNLLALKPSTERVVIMNVMQRMTDEICESFTNVQSEIERQKEMESNQRYY